ncbi:hypothetical protein L1987_24208 [Smallanthus sonchifolius]|uniref:Uncharacterized protein n=1 Tax=Smallanthus sonchifolius TaxID=185202 RepID=A0ACB9IJS8_9ASTR|nr:hypothetical protein L1987_24208 [Smallanthus sonchifolius]
MVVFSIGIAYQVITEGNEIDLRLEPSREKSGRQYSFSEKCPEWESNFWMKFASETLVTASLRDDECDVVFNLRLTVGLNSGVGSRPPTGSDDPYVGETNWSGPFVGVGETRKEMPLAAVEVQGTTLSRCRREIPRTAGQT